MFNGFKCNHINTYNDDCILSQTLQIIYSDSIFESDNQIIALSIHNGADVRGGYTDFKIFGADFDGLLNYSFESWSHILEEENA